MTLLVMYFFNLSLYEMNTRSRLLKVTDEHLTTQELGAVWSAVFVTEFIMLFIINAFTIIAFLRKRHLRKPTTYLIKPGRG